MRGVGDDMIVRVGPERNEEALAKPPVRPFDFTGKPMTGWIYVDSQGLTSDNDLKKWTDLGVTFASTLPLK